MTVRNTLILIFSVLLVAIIALDVNALLAQGVFAAAANLWPDPWVKAGGIDAVFAFFTIYLWIAYREPGAGAKVLWLCSIGATGSIATSIYILLQLRELAADAPIDSLLAKKPA